MNPVLLKPTGERTSQVVVLGTADGRAVGGRVPRGARAALRPVVLDALADLRRRYDVVVCEGAGGAAEINLLAGDLANLPLAAAAGLPAIVVGDIERGGVFASLFGTVALLPDDLRACVRGFVINRFRGDPAAAGRRLRRARAADCGVPMLGRRARRCRGTDIDAEDSLALDRVGRRPAAAAGRRARRGRHPLPPDRQLRRPRPAAPGAGGGGALGPVGGRAGSARPGRAAGVEEHPGRPRLVPVVAGWPPRSSAGGAAVVAVCAGPRWSGRRSTTPSASRAPRARSTGLGWLPVRTGFEADKVLDRPAGDVRRRSGRRARVAGYRIHHGRVEAGPGDAALAGGATTGRCSAGLVGRRAGRGHDAARPVRVRRLPGGVLAWAADRAGPALACRRASLRRPPARPLRPHRRHPRGVTSTSTAWSP